jgi:hypothetical protein
MPGLTTEQFVTKSISIWGSNVFDYRKVTYKDYKTKLPLICIKHNIEFLQTPHQHLRAKKTIGCNECELEFIENLNIEKIHKFVTRFKELKDTELLNRKFIEVINTLLEDKLQRVPNGFWDNNEAVDCYIIWFKHTYKITKDEDWYNIQAETLIKNGASTLLEQYKHSLIEFLNSYYPDKEFLPWKFYRVGNNYWKDKTNKKHCLNWLINKLNYNDYEDYYNLSLNMFNNNECARLVGCYQDSTYELLRDLCPEYKWKAYKFIQVPIKHWTKHANRKEWCEDYYAEHNFSSMDDWYTINQDLIKEWDGNGLIQRYKSSPYQMLKDIYPDHHWDKSKFKVCGYSKKSCEFTENLSTAIATEMRYALSADGEYRVPNTRYSADNHLDKYKEFLNIIIEFHGCDAHGCIIEGCKFRRNLEKIHNRYGKSFIDAYNKTVKKTNILRQLGYIVIEIWECEYATLKRDDTDWKKWFEDKLAETNQS